MIVCSYQMEDNMIKDIKNYCILAIFIFVIYVVGVIAGASVGKK
jgi:hypothetical protein